MPRFIVVLLAVSCSNEEARPTVPAASAVPAAVKHRTEIVMLGTGTPVPDPERSGPSTAIVVDGVAYVFDAGPGVVRRASAAAKRYGLDALLPKRIRYLFVTHLHSDHTLGYPDLLLTPWVVGRPWPLEVYGPPGLASMTEHVRAAWAEDLAVRSEVETRGVDSSTANVHEIEAGPIYKDDHVKITAVPVKHGTWPHAFAYRIDGPDRTIVITGDYAPPADSIIAACDGCDVLISESYASKLAEGPRAAYMRSFHTSALELGEIATKARAKSVVVTHRGADRVLVDEIRRGYAGPVVLANDLDRL